MDNELAYQQTLDYLYSFVDYSLTRAFRFSPEKFDLQRMVLLMEILGHPERRYPIIHVAGTKGKGSVSALCANVLRCAGYKTGLYTSPHLQDYAERVQVDGIPIPHADMVSIIDEIKPAVAKIEGLTTFELTTALGFMYFARQNVDAAVIEVGLGGRLDATNIIDPVVSVITTLSYDHMAVLGDTLAKIAGEKAGIIKPDRPVVSSPQKEEALKVIEDTCAERNAPLHLVGRDILFGPLDHSLDGQSLILWDSEDQTRLNDYIENGPASDWQPMKLLTPLLGYHQLENAATAYAALKLAGENTFEISDQAYREGFASVDWPCRFEVLRSAPPVILDSAHNEDSALKLRLALDDYFPGKPVVLLFGASEDKDVRGILRNLLPRVRQVIATQSVHPRAMDANEIVNIAHQFGCKAEAIIPIETALAEALTCAGQDAAVVATGSLFVAAAARETWKTLIPDPIVG